MARRKSMACLRGARIGKRVKGPRQEHYVYGGITAMGRLSQRRTWKTWRCFDTPRRKADPLLPARQSSFSQGFFSAFLLCGPGTDYGGFRNATSMIFKHSLCPCFCCCFFKISGGPTVCRPVFIAFGAACTCNCSCVSQRSGTSFAVYGNCLLLEWEEVVKTGNRTASRGEHAKSLDSCVC